MLTNSKFQGVLLGLSNTAGVLAGVFGTAATGYILQRGKNAALAFRCLYLFLNGNSLISDVLTVQVLGMMFLRLLLHCT